MVEDLLAELRENQTWIGLLKGLQDTFRDHAGIVESCKGFILWHLFEIERISRELNGKIS